MIIFDDIIKTIKHTHGVREVFKNIKLYLNKSEINYINLKNGHFSSYPRLFERLRECEDRRGVKRRATTTAIAASTTATAAAASATRRATRQCRCGWRWPRECGAELRG